MRGRHESSVDAKGRVLVPIKMREVLGETFIAAVIMEPCVSLYTLDGWNAMLEKLEEFPITKSRNLLRQLSCNAEDVQADSQGRVVIPKHLLKRAKLDKDSMLNKKALIIGAGLNRAEIWNPDVYDAKFGDVSEEDIAADFMALGL